MNIEILKYKNHSSADTLNIRLTRLERMLEELMAVSVNSAKNQNGSLITGGLANNYANTQDKLISQLAAMSIERSASANVNPASFTIKPKVNTLKTGLNNLLLSQGQVIAEIASAIARAGNRNS